MVRAVVRVRAFVVAVAAVVLILLGVVLGIDNHTPVTLRFLNKESAELAVFWWLYAAFLLGTLVGFALCSFGFVRGKLNERRLKGTLARRDRELAELRDGEAA